MNTFLKSSRGKEEQTKCFAIKKNYNMNAKYIMNNLLNYRKKMQSAKLVIKLWKIT